MSFFAGGGKNANRRGVLQETALAASSPWAHGVVQAPAEGARLGPQRRGTVLPCFASLAGAAVFCGMKMVAGGSTPNFFA
jgi:hypothetical protein